MSKAFALCVHHFAICRQHLHYETKKSSTSSHHWVKNYQFVDYHVVAGFYYTSYKWLPEESIEMNETKSR